MGEGGDADTWGACRYCGTAVAPGATVCALCGEDRPVPASGLAKAPRPVRRRIALTNWLRALIVVGLAVALAYTLIDAVWTGPPVVADPLTTTGTYHLAPGTQPILDGAVTGGDYVVGNFTTIQPFDAAVTLSVYNWSQWYGLVTNGTGSPAWSTPSEGSGRIIFTALDTGTYVFVLTDPLPLNMTVYVATEYESNVGDDGFG